MMKTIKVSGFTLIELLIAMGIGLGLLAGVISLLVATSTTYKIQHQNAYIQENIRATLEVVGRELRLAGHETLTIQRAKTKVASEWSLHGVAGSVLSTAMFTAKPGVRGYEAKAGGGWTPSLPSPLTSLAVPPIAGSDVLIVTYRQPLDRARVSATVVNPQDGNTIQLINVTNNLIIRAGAILGIEAGMGDVGGDIFVNQTSINNGNSILTKPAGKQWEAAYDQRAYIYQHKVVAYYVGREAVANGQLGLYQFVLGESDPVALVEGISNLQLQFKLRNDSSGVWSGGLSVGGYASANIINAQPVNNIWGEVDAIKLGLLFQGDEADTSASRPTDQSLQVIAGSADSTVIIPANTPTRYQAITTVMAVRNNL